MRCFAGIQLSPDIRAVCAGIQERLRAAALDARYDPPENFHLTLAFLGNVEDGRLDELSGTLRGAAKRCAPFTLTFDRLGAFPNERRPRIVWVGSRAHPAAYRELAAAVRGAYVDLGFSFDDDAIAHVTIARIKGGAERPVPLIDLEPAAMAIREVALFESLSENGCTHYAVRSRATLGATQGL